MFRISTITAVAFWVVAACASGQDVKLSLAVAVAKDDAGIATIERTGKFQIVLKNLSGTPVRFWNPEGEFGYQVLSFGVRNNGGKTWSMRRRNVDPSVWKKLADKAAVVVVAAGETLVWRVSLSDFFWGEPAWIGVPDPNTQEPVKLTAVVDVPATPAAKVRGVWTGRVDAEPISAVVVDAGLKTPMDYLGNGFPDRALVLLKSNVRGIAQLDELQRTPLHLAGRFGFVEAATWLIANGADVNAKAYNGFTPLHYTPHPEIVKLLIQAKADLETLDNFGSTPLKSHASTAAHLASASDCAEQCARAKAVVELLRDAGAKYDIYTAVCLGDIDGARRLVRAKGYMPDGQAMRVAVEAGNVELVKALLQGGGDPHVSAYRGFPVSFFAVKHADVLKVLFAAGADPKTRITDNGDGRRMPDTTLLHQAVGAGSLESVKLLLSLSLDVNLAVDKRLTTPLHVAAGGARLDVVKILLAAKANPNAKQSDGATPVQLAAANVRPEHEQENAAYQATIRALVAGGAELDVFGAIACDDVPRIKQLIQANPKVGNTAPHYGRPALHRAVENDRREIVELLLGGGADPNLKGVNTGGYENETPLLQAAFWGRPEIAALLVKRGADVNAAADGGVVPLHEAARMGNLAVADILLKNGARVNALDSQGRTPLAWTNSEATKMVELLRAHGGTK